MNKDFKKYLYSLVKSDKLDTSDKEKLKAFLDEEFEKEVKEIFRYQCGSSDIVQFISHCSFNNSLKAFILEHFDRIKDIYEIVEQQNVSKNE